MPSNSKPRSSVNVPGDNFGNGCLRFWENWPIIGHIMAFVYWMQNAPAGEPERAAIWGTFGFIPFLNFWRCGIAVWRHWWCCDGGPTLPSDCTACSNNRLLYGETAFNGPSNLKLGRTELNSWMRHPEVRSKKLFSCAIPGSHDAAAFSTSYVGGLLRSWSLCQHEGILEQLKKGARWFDIRLRDTSVKEYVKDPCMCGKTPAEEGRFWAAHTFLTSPLNPILKDVETFLGKEEATQEIVIFTIKPDYPTKLDNSGWRGVYDSFLTYFPKSSFILRSDLQMTIGELQDAGKQILILVDGCYCGDRRKDNSIEQLVEWRGILNGSWSKTNSDCPTILQDKATGWLKGIQSKMGNDSFYMLQCELTPTTELVMSSIAYMKPSVDTFLNMEDQACAAHRVVRSSLYNPGPWSTYNINVVTHDYVSAEICSLIVLRNFSSDEVQKAFLEGRPYPGGNQIEEV